MSKYDNQKKNNESLEAAEPSMPYSPSIPSNSIHFQPLSELPDGYMTLEQFGEVFHQRLDCCYAS